MKLQITDKGHAHLTSVQYAKIYIMTEDNMLIAEALEEFSAFDGNQLPMYMPLRIKYTLYLLRGKQMIELIPETGLEEAELMLIDNYKKPKSKVSKEVLDAVKEAKKEEKKTKKIKGDSNEHQRTKSKRNIQENHS